MSIHLPCSVGFQRFAAGKLRKLSKPPKTNCMSRGPGRVQRAIIALTNRHRDGGWDEDELAQIVFGVDQVKKRHRDPVREALRRRTPEGWVFKSGRLSRRGSERRVDAPGLPPIGHLFASGDISPGLRPTADRFWELLEEAARSSGGVTDLTKVRVDASKKHSVDQKPGTRKMLARIKGGLGFLESQLLIGSYDFEAPLGAFVDRWDLVRKQHPGAGTDTDARRRVGQILEHILGCVESMLGGWDVA
jgi:hypothetical protein